MKESEITPDVKLLKVWESIVHAYKTGSVITGTIKSKTKGGLIVDYNGLEMFLPGAHIDIKPIIDISTFIGRTMEFKVVKINEEVKYAVVSHLVLFERDLEEQRFEIVKALKKGQIIEGVVKHITDFGAFLDLGGVDGLLRISDISWDSITHPGEVIKLDQKLNVVVLDIDEDKKRIFLGLKQLEV